MQQSDRAGNAAEGRGPAKPAMRHPPRVRAKANESNSVTHKALAQTPERRALLSRLHRSGHQAAPGERWPSAVPPSQPRPGCLWAFHQRSGCLYQDPQRQPGDGEQVRR